MACKSQYGISVVCNDLPYATGVDPVFWVGYLDELSAKISLLQTAAISTLSFVAYAGLRKFEGQKFAHNAGHSLIKGAGGTISYRHYFTPKLLSLSTLDDVEVQRFLSATNAFIIYKNNNNDFKILGASKGMQSVAGDLQTEGQDSAADPTDTFTMEGFERTKPLRFFVTDEAATEAYLNARVI